MHKLIDCKTGWRSSHFDEDIIADCANGGIEVLEHDCCWNDAACADYDYSAVQQTAQKYGIYMQSVHLALGDKLDISYKPPKAYALDVLTRQLINTAKADVKYAVLHASAEPIGDSERKSRMMTAADSILRLCEVAAKHNITLCLEDLPRSCLCNDIDELSSLLSLDSSLRVCFDVNHLLKCTHAQFMQAFGEKIVTTHISDYDFVDDRHWVPGEGKIDWAELADLFEQYDYHGAFLFECDVDRMRDKSIKLPRTAYRKIHENIANRLNPLNGLV